MAKKPTTQQEPALPEQPAQTPPQEPGTPGSEPSTVDLSSLPPGVDPNAPDESKPKESESKASEQTAPPEPPKLETPPASDPTPPVPPVDTTKADAQKSAELIKKYINDKVANGNYDAVKDETEQWLTENIEGYEGEGSTKSK